jgi:hypothetical protein
MVARVDCGESQSKPEPEPGNDGGKGRVTRYWDVKGKISAQR